MGWWDAAYRSGRVPWDPGEYDRHLDWVLETVSIPGKRVLDIGCGTGNSAIWLAKSGFTVTGIDPAASGIAIARQSAKRQNIPVRFVAGSFPGVINALSSPDHQPVFDLITDRATLQHIGSRSGIGTLVKAIAAVTAPGGVLYSLMLTGEGLPWGTGDWNERTIRRRFGAAFIIERIERVVFTPDEPGSVPAWLTIARKPGQI